MKKKLIMISIILILSSYIVNIIFPIEKVLALDSLPFLSSRNECKGKYEVVIISAGNPPQITGKCPAFTSQSYDNIAHVSCADTYGEAKEIMNNLKSTSTNVASIIYNGTIIDAKYAILDLRTKGSTSYNTNIFSSSTSKSAISYINGYYGIDAPLLDYNPNNGRVKLKISGLVGWINKKDDKNLVQYEIVPISLVRSPTYYYVDYNETLGYNELKHNLGIGTSYSSGKGISYYNCSSNAVNIGPAPFYLQPGVKYHSYDGNYFYDDLIKMIDDYKNNVYTNAINSHEPYYNYYLYLSYRTKTSYTGDDINHYLTTVRGYTAKPAPRTPTTGLPSHLSMLYNEGHSFIESQNEFGANTLLSFGLAVNESGWGRSSIAINKNNIFGHGAYDYNPGPSAESYASVKSSIDYHSDYWVSSWYLHPDDWRYFGSHFGNKLSGMNVKYASDPYWGEKTAQHYYAFDRANGLSDYELYTIGIKNTNPPTVSLNIRKEPNTSSAVIYEMKNKNMGVANMPVIILDTVEGETINGSNLWYKIQTDAKLDSNRNRLPHPSYRATYDWDICYGYVHSSYIKIINSSELYIIASSKIILLDSDFDPMENVRAYDQVDGDITDRIEIIKNDVDTSIVGNYEVIYKVSNNRGKEATKTVVITVKSDTPPVINVSNIEILQYQSYNPFHNVIATDNEDGNISYKLQVISNNVNNTKVGEYKVKYRVVDSDYNYVDKEITVIVRPSDKPFINAVNRTIERGQTIDLLENVTATDNEDGDLTDSINLIAGNVNTNIPGVYYVTYSVTDNDNNRVNKTVSITVNGEYNQVNGNFYLHSFEWDSNDKLNISGYLTIIGVNNVSSQYIMYEMIFKKIDSNEMYVLHLNRLTEFNLYPFKIPSENGFNYSDSWFKGTVDLSLIPEGDYEIMIKARMNGRETTAILRNTFSRVISRKATDSNGRGYLFRSNYYLKKMPLEVFIRDKGLISDVKTPTLFDNMFNSYSKIDLLKSGDNVLLDIKGTSFNIMGDYKIGQYVIREMIFENIDTYERFSKDLGYVDNANTGVNKISLRVPDGKDKTRAWFNRKINITDLNIGRYVIYIRTKAGAVDDYDELTDIFHRPLGKSITLNGKTYTLILNSEKRARIELIISDN